MYFYTGQTKSRKWSLRLQRGGKKHPTHEVPTIKDQSPLSKVKTVMQEPPSGRNFDKIAEKTKLKCPTLQCILMRNI